MVGQWEGRAGVWVPVLWTGGGRMWCQHRGVHVQSGKSSRDARWELLRVCPAGPRVGLVAVL